MWRLLLGLAVYSTSLAYNLLIIFRIGKKTDRELPQKNALHNIMKYLHSDKSPNSLFAFLLHI